MALNNIIGPKDQQETSKGAPLAGGFVFLYEPGTTTFITSYTDANLVTPHTNPVRLSGSGRQNIWITRDCDIIVNDRNGNLIWSQDNANPDDLGGDASGGLVPNGSFEEVTTPPVPDGWVAVNEAGSSNAVDPAFSTDGLNSYRFTSSGVGGGSLTTTDFFPVNDVDQLRVNFDMFATLATVLNIVRVEWYDVTFVSISNSDVYSSTANPLAWTEFQLIATPPALARFAKLKLIGIDPSVPLAGSTYYDRISVFYPTIVSGIFDNITIQNNEIISTNLNGEISLLPNGLGPVNIMSSGAVDLADVQNPLNISTILDPATNVHIAMDENTIQGKLNATTIAGITLQRFGGMLNLGSGNLGDPTVPDAITSLMQFRSQDSNTYGQAGYDAGANLILRNLAETGLVQLWGTDVGSVAQLFLQGDPDDNVQLYYSNAAVVRTEAASNGGLEVNNTLTGGGWERVLTTGDASVLLPVGTVTNATLRWDGAAWVEETSALITSGGEVQTASIRPPGTSLTVAGMDDTDIGLLLEDGTPITFENVTESANPVAMWNKGIATNTVVMAAATGFSLRLLNGSFQLRNAADTFGASFSFLDSTQDRVILSGPPVFDVAPAIRMTQRTAATAPDPVAVSMSFWPEDAVVDDDIQMFTRVGQFPTADRVLAQLNTKRIANQSLSMSGSAQNSQHAMNSTFFYDDGANYSITLEDSGFERFPLQSTFTIINAGSGTISVLEGTGDTLYYLDPGVAVTDTAGGATIAIGGFATVYRDTAGDWFIMGGGITP